MNTANRWLRAAAIGLASIVFVTIQSCAVLMEESRPLHKNVGVLEPGNDRSEVLSELGLPDQNYRTTEGGQVDVYKIAISNETTSSKVGKSALYILLDTATLGLAEEVETPVERQTQPEVKTFVVTYGHDNKIQRVASYHEGVTFDLPTNIASEASPPKEASSTSPTAPQ